MSMMKIGPLFAKIADEVQAALGRYVATFANLEYYLASGSWGFFNDGPGMDQTARKNGDRLLQLYTRCFEGLLTEARGTIYEPEAVWLDARFAILKSDLDALIKERNAVVHAAWVRGDGSCYRVVEVLPKKFGTAVIQLDRATLDAMTAKVAELSGATLEFVTLVRDGIMVRIRNGLPPADLSGTTIP